MAAFTRQLALLVRAGLPILRSLEVLARQAPGAAFRGIVLSLAETIRSGGDLSDGLAAYERVFGRLYVRMVKAGEAGGVLDVVLDRLAAFLEKTQRIRSKVRTAMIYPGIVTSVAAAIVTALMVFVVPRFQDIFSGLLKGQPLPGLTQALLDVGNAVREQFVAGIGVLMAFGLGLRFAAGRPCGRRALDWLLLHLPMARDLFLKVAIARFTRTFGTLLAAGVPILHALLMARDTSGNVHVGAAIASVHDQVGVGRTVAYALEAQRLFPAMVTSMIEVGEETGALPDMLDRIADAYDDEVDNLIAGLTTMIEPAMIVFMALVVGTIVIALFLPLVGIVQHL